MSAWLTALHSIQGILCFVHVMSALDYRVLQRLAMQPAVHCKLLHLLKAPATLQGVHNTQDNYTLVHVHDRTHIALTCP